MLIQALCPEPFIIHNLSEAKDTQTLQALLSGEREVLDAGPAGTTFRFLTAYFSLQGGTQTLTGSERMKQRPIAVLVDALRQLGANIRYLGEKGYPPLCIGPPEGLGEVRELTVQADISSQYISALLMIAPVLPRGLRIRFLGQPVSLPYIQMTLRMMGYLGIRHEMDEQGIRVFPSPYQARDFLVEADWSAASYHYALAALSDTADIQVDGLFGDSLQGDSIIAEIAEKLGIQTTFNDTGIRISKERPTTMKSIQQDFSTCPDIAQTVAVICAGLGVEADLYGLKTLRIKETDRIAALGQELARVGVKAVPYTRADDEALSIRGKARVDYPVFRTYEDHRMAMSFAPLGLLGQVGIETPEVVQKSYPSFWSDLEKLGFIIT